MGGKRMKTMVIGGSGFVGSHVADCLTEAGHQVIIFDLNKSTYLSHGQKMVIGDILDQKTVEKAMKGCDYVYNFAGIADLDDASTKPLETIKQNVLGATVLLEASLKSKIKRFIMASTIYVYSDKGGFYRCSKHAAEIYIEEYQKQYELDFTILRFGTLYGLRADSRNSIYRYLNQALNNGKIICQGTGEELREYINVKDAAKLSVQILSKEFINKHVIITGHHVMKFGQMLQYIKEMLNNKIDIEFDKSINNSNQAHYNITPYSFIPKIGTKIVSNCYTDMGQGLLECLNEIYQGIKNE
jgi:UDP-glucose 4-epimerase